MVLTREAACFSSSPPSASAPELASEPAAPAHALVLEEVPQVEEQEEEPMEVEREDAEVEEVHVVEDEADDDQAEEAQEEAGKEQDDGQAGQGDAPGVEAVPPPPLQPERWTVRVRQTQGLCFFARVLRLLFHRLHMIVEIEYVGAHKTHQRYPKEWLVLAHIRTPDYEYGGIVDVAVHHAIAAKATFEAGISDAASQALSVLCHYGGADLDNSPWRHFPQRPEGEMRSAIVGV
jgi:hypothetical protein